MRERSNRKYGDTISPPESGGVRGGLRSSYARLLPEGRKNARSPAVVQTTPDPSYSGGEIPIVISSGYRSEEVNRKCGGAKGSNHLTGCAVDVKCMGPEQMIRYACLHNRTTSAQNNNLTNFTQSRFRQRKWDFLHKNDIDTI